MSLLGMRNLQSLLDECGKSIMPNRCRGLTVKSPEVVMLPPLRRGQQMLDLLVHEDADGRLGGYESQYLSVTPWVCEFHNVTVHTSAGILSYEDCVVTDTLLQTTEQQNNYKFERGGVEISSNEEVIDMPGTYLSLLAGNHNNYYHWMMDCIARLAAIDDGLINDFSRVLVPKLYVEFQSASISLTGISSSHEILAVAPGQTLRVEHLVVPWTIHGHHTPHPCIKNLFRKMADRACLYIGRTPKRIYIDRRATRGRRFVTEDLIISSLEKMNFIAVKLECLTLSEQISIFQGADIVVGSHGAGLTNILFMRPGTTVIELQVDNYLTWCYRHLAAIMHVNYDCVIGRQLFCKSENSEEFNWSISLFHLLIVVEESCDKFNSF